MVQDAVLAGQFQADLMELALQFESERGDHLAAGVWHPQLPVDFHGRNHRRDALMVQLH